MKTLAPKSAATHVASAMRDGTPLRVFGADGCLRGLCLAEAAADPRSETPVVYVAADDASARTVAQDTAFFLGARRSADVRFDRRVLVVPEFDVSLYADVSPDPRAVAARLAGLARLRDDPPRVVIMSVRSLMRKAMPTAGFEQLCTVAAVGTELEPGVLADRLTRAGYQRVDRVEDPGTFATRGGLLDAFVPRLSHPVRIEWWGDEIEKIRTFDPQTQRSVRAIERVAVHPVRETVPTIQASLRSHVLALGDRVNAPSSATRQVIENLEAGLDFFGIDALTPIFHPTMVPIWEYLPPGTRWFIEEPDALVSLHDRLLGELEAEYSQAEANHRLVAAPETFSVDRDAFKRNLDGHPVVAHRVESFDPQHEGGGDAIRFEVDRSARLRLDLELARKNRGGEILRPVVDHIRGLDTDRGPWSVVLAAPNLTHAERLTSLMRGYGFDPNPPQSIGERPVHCCGPEQGETTIEVVAGELSSGYASGDDRFLLLSEADIFGRITRRARRSNRRVGVGNLAQLAVGDYVVHVTHGVGRYTGLQKLVLRGIPGDFVVIDYASADKLYLPVYRLGEIERYVSAQSRAPKLDRMGGSTFSVKTARVKAEVRQIAEELLQIYAQREAQSGHAHEVNLELQAEFEATFPFEETSDQQDAIDAVAKDLGRAQPMDRLICGDVGFGKTEVALRAAFRVAAGGKQVAVLAPTTVLVQQHYQTFLERVERFGLKVGRLGRMTDTKQRRALIEQARDGTVDIVIGTHRLLGRDVRFKDLGLVIIDEEQRFGVTQKERFKRLKTQVDVLTLSATPIPRTLHLSLLGIREISLIMTPPVDRLAVRTLLTRPSDAVIESGIRKELRRGGQVFYVVPKIEGIEAHAVRIRALCPEARVLVAHGKMPPELLEKTMLDFVEHRADVLVATTIIESGLDIPRANTMFVSRSDMFGLSQLYQLRGRIGRSKHRAYCYLMVQALERLAPESRRRLEAVQRYSELGSGFHVASQDLEIRGAGEILGARQSGQIQAIGFDAYSRILGEAVAELRGQAIVSEADPEIVFDVPAFLPEEYVEDTGTRLDLYRRLSAAAAIEEIEAVKDEIRDRFGEPPPEAVALGFVMACKMYGKRLQALSLELRRAKLTIRLPAGASLDADVVALLGRRGGAAKRVSGDRIVVELSQTSQQGILEAAQNALRDLATRAQRELGSPR